MIKSHLLRKIALLRFQYEICHQKSVTRHTKLRPTQKFLYDLIYRIFILYLYLDDNLF